MRHANVIGNRFNNNVLNVPLNERCLQQVDPKII